jgi:oligoribonuclease
LNQNQNQNQNQSQEVVTLIWLDLEMTGLHIASDFILEAAALVTDIHFNELASLEEVVFQSPEVLEKMDDWCKKNHGESGLLAKVPSGISEAELDQKLFDLLALHAPKGRPILAGNSISQDRKFVDKFLPQFAKRLHYRMLDVSSFKIIFESKFGIKFKKQNKHRALDDIHESLRELKLYLQYFKLEGNDFGASESSSK